MNLKLKLLLQNVEDRQIQDAFKQLETALNAEAVLKGQFQFFRYVFAGAVTALKIPHGLNFRPLDVIQTSVAAPDTATVTWKYDSFDATNVVVTTSGACTVRAYIGRYAETIV